MRGFPIKTETGSGNTHGTGLFAISSNGQAHLDPMLGYTGRNIEFQAGYGNIIVHSNLGQLQ